MPPLEQRRVVGQEPLSEQRLVGQPALSEASPLHLRLHRGLIMATRHTVTGTRLTVTQPTHRRAMDTQAIRDTLPIPGLRATDTKAIRHSLLTPVPRPMDRQATWDTLVTPNPRLTDTKAAR